MTNSSPQTPPPSPDEQRVRQRVRQETIDEWIAVIVAFGTIGAILFWSLGLRKNNFFTTQWNQTFAFSGDTVEDNQDIERQVFTTADNLETTETQLKTFEEETPSSSLQSFLSDDLYSLESSTDNQGLSDSLIGAVPLMGVITPETAPEPEVTEPETAPEPEATEPETAPEPEATEPETAPETETVVSFADVSGTHWAYPFIQELGEQQLIAATSDNNFEPDDLITRAGMATLISQAFDKPQTKASKDFQDIDDGNVIVEDINKAVGIGFMKGYSDDEFRPTENIPRYQVLVALATGLGLEPSGDPLFILRNFSDRNEIPKWAISQVAAATEAGLAVNRPDFDLTSLRPEEPATRAEVAAMIYQSLEQLGTVEKIDSSYIVPKP